MIEKTVFRTKEELIELVHKMYNIKVNQVEKIDRGSANLYCLNKKEYILKEFQSKYTKKEIEIESVVIEHLNKHKVSVPKYIRTRKGEFYFTYKERVIIMQEFIEGYTMESNTANYEQTMESAEKLGQIVKALQNLNYKLPVSDVLNCCSNEQINESIEKQKKLMSKISKEKDMQIYTDLQDKIEMLKYVRENVDLKDMNNLTLLNTHGDYSVMQFIYKDEKINAVIDFVSACKMPIVWEIIRSYSYIDYKAKNGKIDINNFIDYVKTFTKYVPLNKCDIKYMPYLYLIQLLSSTFGYKQYINDNSNTSLLDFAFFRTNLCKELFENAEKISKALINTKLSN